MNIYFLGIMISMVIYIIIGIWSGKKVKNVNDYYVSGRSAPTIMIFATLFASMLSVNGFMGDLGWSFTGNIVSMMIINALCAVGYVLGPVIFGKYLRRSNCITMPQYFGERYNNRKNRQVAGIITIISITAYLLSSINGVGILLNALLPDLSHSTSLILSWLCFTAFTFYSGSRGVILTDLVMSILFIGSSIIGGIFIFNATGGVQNLLYNLLQNPYAPEGILNYHSYIAGTGATTPFGATMYAIIMGIVWMITVAVSPWQAGRNLMAKNEHVIFRSGALSAITTILFLLFLNLSAVSVLNINPHLEQPEMVFIWASFNVMPELVSTIILTGILAAGLSSASTFLSVIGFSATSDIFNIKFKDDKSKLKSSRIVMLFISLIALGLSLAGMGGIRVIAWFASTIIAASWAVPAIGSIWWSKLSAMGARWAMMAGFMFFMVSRILVELIPNIFSSIFTNFLDPFFIGIYASAVFAIIGSKISPITTEEKAYRKNIMRIPSQDLSLKEYKINIKYAYLLIISGITVSVFLVMFWGLPMVSHY